MDKAPATGTSGMGFAWRLATEMVAATVIGCGIGYGLDRWLDSAPWFTLVFFLFGVAAGFLNVFRAANPELYPGNRPPPAGGTTPPGPTQ